MSHDREPERQELRLTKECRSFLRQGLADREALDPTLRTHVDACSFCSARRAAKKRLTAALSRPATPPPQLHSAAFLDEIRARIVEASEESPCGRFLGIGMPVAAPSSVEDAWPSDLLESDLGRRTMAMRDLATGPTWARVRASVLENVVSHRLQRTHQGPALRNRTWALAGIAVAAIICTWLVSDGGQSSPEIVITDIVAMPNLEVSPMAVLRHGEMR
jgi:hypothetical protein